MESLTRLEVKILKAILVEMSEDKCLFTEELMDYLVYVGVDKKQARGAFSSLTKKDILCIDDLGETANWNGKRVTTHSYNLLISKDEATNLIDNNA